MPRSRPWWGLLVLSTCVALALALGLAMLATTLSLALAAAENSSLPADPSFVGLVTDSLCGPRHETASNHTSAECTQLCVKKGGKYILVNGDHVYTLTGDASYLSQMAGLRVRVWGKLNADTIHVRHAVIAQ